MALFNTPLHRGTTKQIRVLLKGRNKSGAHAYYTSGHRADEKKFLMEFAGTFINGSTLITAFEYKGPQRGDKHSIYYGLYNRHEKTYLRVDFSEQCDFGYIDDEKPTPVTVYPIQFTALGLHVVEYRRKAGSIEVYLDGQLLFPGDKPVAQPKFMRVFYTAEPGSAPFIFWESHCNMNVPLEAMKGMGQFTFKHENISLVLGGYAVYEAEWERNTLIHLQAQNKEVASVVSTGFTTCLLKVYRLGFIFVNAAHRVQAHVITDWPWHKAPEIPLSGLVASPLPIRAPELRIVSGHFSIIKL
ncbi:uncharacterized protein LOC144104995 [Amblyomma americanum]